MFFFSLSRDIKYFLHGMLFSVEAFFCGNNLKRKRIRMPYLQRHIKATQEKNQEESFQFQDLNVNVDNTISNLLTEKKCHNVENQVDS